jgi:hypothetical protein
LSTGTFACNHPAQRPSVGICEGEWHVGSPTGKPRRAVCVRLWHPAPRGDLLGSLAAGQLSPSDFRGGEQAPSAGAVVRPRVCGCPPPSKGMMLSVGVVGHRSAVAVRFLGWGAASPDPCGCAVYLRADRPPKQHPWDIRPAGEGRLDQPGRALSVASRQRLFVRSFVRSFVHP